MSYNIVVRTYRTVNHSKHLLLYHIIFSTKYRKNIFVENDEFITNLKSVVVECVSKTSATVEAIEVDTNHLHMMVRLTSVHSISRLVHCIKQFTTYYMWKRHSLWLSRFYWNKHYLWTRGYFSSTIGNVSDTTLEMYIKNQG